MTQEAGFQIGKRFYPFPAGFRLGDPVLVEALTDLTWAEFIDRLPDDDVDQAPDDPVVLLGLIGVSISQAHTAWRRDRVVAYTTGLNMETVEFIGGETEDEENDARPPVKAGEANSDRSPTASNNSSETSNQPEPSNSEPDSEKSNPATSGPLTSPTSPVAPLASTT